MRSARDMRNGKASTGGSCADIPPSSSDWALACCALPANACGVDFDVAAPREVGAGADNGSNNDAAADSAEVAELTPSPSSSLCVPRAAASVWLQQKWSVVDHEKVVWLDGGLDRSS